MADCFQESDIKELGNSVLSDYDRELALIPENMCAPFHRQAGLLENGLLFTYRATVMCVRREEDITKVASRWEDMVNVCDESLARLKSLAERHPHCGTGWYYDRVLDLRNKCQRLQEMHR
jgi:hypothetical protein